jgi:hypothetical protein
MPESMPAATGEGEAAEEAPAATEPADAEAGGFAVPWEDLRGPGLRVVISGEARNVYDAAHRPVESHQEVNGIICRGSECRVKKASGPACTAAHSGTNWRLTDLHSHSAR